MHVSVDHDDGVSDNTARHQPNEADFLKACVQVYLQSILPDMTSKRSHLGLQQSVTDEEVRTCMYLYMYAFI